MRSSAPGEEQAELRRERARQIVRATATRLADPVRVAAVSQAPGNVLPRPSGEPLPVWSALGLGDAHPAVSLLFSELAVHDPGQQEAAYRHLSAAVSAGIGRTPLLLHGGMMSLAFAGHMASAGAGGYRAMLSRLDEQIVLRASERFDADLARQRAGEPVGSHDTYDVISGAAGIGRYVLGRYTATGDPALADALTAALRVLVSVALAAPVVIEGQRLPAWWAWDSVGGGVRGHLNLGVAHGVAGPLALLALATAAGVRVDGQDEAIERIVALLLRWRDDDDAGPYWPRWITAQNYRDRAPNTRRGRDVWCYGSAGVARAIYLAGIVLGRDDWQGIAHAALDAALTTASEPVITDDGLCHGWSGLLYLACRMWFDTGRAAYLAAADVLAGRVMSGYDASQPFGFSVRPGQANHVLHRAGFLDGAAGIALGLSAYANAAAPATPWDSALLLT